MTTPARYPTYHEVRVRIDAMYGCVTQAPSPTQMIDIIRHAIDIERERVEKDAGEVSCWRVAGGTWVDGEPLPCDYKDAEQNGWAIELAYISPVFAGKTGTETRALVVQNSAANPLSPGEYFRCDECHEPAGLRQVCRSCVRLEIERDDAVESQNSAVKVPDGLIESLSRNWQISDDVSVCGVHREAVDMAITILQSLTHPTETPR